MVSPEMVSLYELPTYISMVADFVLLLELPPGGGKIKKVLYKDEMRARPLVQVVTEKTRALNVEGSKSKHD